MNYLISFPQHSYQILGLLGVRLGEQGVRCSGCVRTTGSANSMDVVLRVLRVVKVDDKLNSVHVYFINACKQIVISN